MKAYTSRARFDETRNFTGVYQQMGRVSVDADWNEEVQIRTTDARRRASDLAQGSPDDGFSISDEHLIDRVSGVGGWQGSGLEPGDTRVIPPELRLDRREPEGLPWVIRSHGHVRVERRFARDRDLTALPLAPASSFAAAALVFSLRFERPANDDDLVQVELFLVDADGNRARVSAGFGEQLPEQWTSLRIPLSAFAGVDPQRIRAWGVGGLPPRATTWLEGLRATDAQLPLSGSDFVVRGGDGSPGAARMWVDGLRAYLPEDVRYSRQPDLADPPALSALPADRSRAHVVYLDVWEELVTALDDPFLSEPALDGFDTTVRLRSLAQIKVLQAQDPAAPLTLPAATGGGTLTTNVPAGSLPDRYPADALDPCRDRCLFSESAALGQGYTGAHNLHLRVEVLSSAGPHPVFGWSRDNGSTRLPLLADAPASATTLLVSGEDAQQLRAGDVIVISDRRIDRQPEGARRAVLRVIRSADPASGTLLLRDADFELATSPAPLIAGGPLGESFAVADRAYVRRWDGADWLLDDVRYNLPDGIALRFGGSAQRTGDYWSFTARVHSPDGAARGVVEQLDAAPVHGPVHHLVPLARVTRQADQLLFEDLRPRFLPLGAVRERLRELAEARAPSAAFTLIVGDGVRTFGDIDQDLAEGVTGDEALQSAVNTLRLAGGGTLYIRAGEYRLEKPVLLSGCSRLRVLGDGEASRLRVVGAGGAFVIDGCGQEGELSLERLSLVEAPLESSVIGADAEELPEPAENVEPLEPADLLLGAPSSPSFSDTVAASLLVPERLSRRTLNAVRATLEALRRLQRAHPGVPVESVPAAAPLLAALLRLPHGVVTVGDSQRVTLERLSIESRGPQPEAAGVFVTGTCSELRVLDCRVTAASAIVAVPYAPYLSRAFLAHNVRSGLHVDGLVVRGNVLAARGGATHGIYLADGVLRDVALCDNAVNGFAVGIAVQVRLEASLAPSAVAIAGNRVTASTALGIDVVGRDVELADNRVANAAPVGLIQAGVRVRGSGIRVRDCEVLLPAAATPLSSPLGFVAGIVVGTGADTGATPGSLDFAGVDQVDVSGCRVRGAGAAYPGIGVLIGGREPALGVRVRDCDLLQLGDAAVRVWGHGGKVGRVHVEHNRIQSVALADVPARADAQPGLAALAPELAAELAGAGVDFSDPRALMQALTASTSAAALAPLDALLRWVALRTLRGALVFDQVFEGNVAGNRIDGVGSDAAAQVADVRTAAVAVIGCLEVSVHENQIENVFAQRTSSGEPPLPGTPRPPVAFATLEELSQADDERHAERVDVHLAATALRRLILSYAAGDDSERQRIGRRIYASMEALVSDLDALGGAGSKIAASLALEADEMRAAQGRDDHTRAAHRVRASLSRAAAFTAESDLAQEAWDAATQLDLAIVAGNVVAAATRLQDAAGELAEGLPERAAALENALAQVLATPTRLDRLLAAAGELGTLGEWRDAAERRGTSRTPADLLGPKRTVVTRFAERLQTETERLEVDADAENRNLLDALDTDRQALLDALRGNDDDLARRVEVDWRSLERSVTPERKARLQSTLAEARAWADGRETGSGEAASAEDVQRLGDAGGAALTALVARHLDDNIASLTVEPEGMKTKSLRTLQTALGQLRQLVDDDPQAAELATRAGAAVAAAAQDTQARSSQLATARTLLDSIRRRAQILVPPPPRPTPPSAPALGLDRLVAALGAAALSFRIASTAELAAGLALYRDHFARALDAARIAGAVRSSALAVSNAALDSLARSPGTSARERSIQALLRELDRVLAALPQSARSAGVNALVVVIHAALLGLSPDDDAATRLLRVQAYLRERGSALSQSVLQQLARQTELGALLDGLRAVLERLSRGERPFVPEPEPPRFDRQLAPADGVFAAAPLGRLRIAGNRIQHAVRGVTLLPDDGHALVGAARTGNGAVLEIAHNRLDGCALGGLDLRLSGDVALSLSDNAVFACAGVAEPGPDGIGQCVSFVRGAGQLLVAGNSSHDNGHEQPGAVAHELAIDWRGEVVVRGNALRQGGGGAGGAGLLLVAEATPSGLPRRLASAPFLGVEPPPANKRPGAAIETAPPPVNLPLVKQLAQGLVATNLVTAEQTWTGRLVQTTSSARIAPRLITRAVPPRPGGLAAVTATRYLDRGTLSPLRDLLDFVRPWEYWKPLPLPPPPEQRSFHVEGNDVVARGPALLLVADEEGDLISASVVANSLHSSGATGTAYVRFAESLVFTGNRCQAPDAVNVVVIRALDSAVSVTGNVVVGREPIAPPAAPKTPKPKAGAGLGAALHLSLGEGAEISLPVDPVKLRGNLEAFSSRAQQAFADVLLERAAAEEPFLPELELNETSSTLETGSSAAAASAPARGSELGAPAEARVSAGSATLAATAARTASARTRESFGEALELGKAAYVKSPFSSPQPAANVLKYITDNGLGSREVEAVIRGTELQAFESEASRKQFLDQVDLYRKTKKLEEVASKQAVDKAVERAEAGRVFQRVATQPDTQAGALSEMTRLFTAQGFEPTRTAAEVKALLDQSGGDATKALGTLKTDILATHAASVPARKVLDNAGLLEHILIDGLIRTGDALAEPVAPSEPPAPPSPAPDPYACSLVVLGGASVAAVGNATSAGTLVLDASESVELNV